MMKFSRSLAAVSAAALSLSLVPGLPDQQGALAANPYVISSSCVLDGNGTSANPYLIRTVTDLLSVRICTRNADADVYFEQVSNVYLDPNRNYPSWSVRLNDKSFSYEGNGYGVFGLNQNVGDRAGLFPEIENETGSLTPTLSIKNLHLSAGTIVAFEDNDNAYMGALLGATDNVVIDISNVSVEVSRIESVQVASGLIGDMYEVSGTIANTSVRVGEIVVAGDFGSGGLVGNWRNNGGQARITNSTAIVDFTINGGGFSEGNVGGLVGDYRDGTLTIESTRYQGDIVGEANSDVLGGFVGEVRSDTIPSHVVIQDSVANISMTGRYSLGGIVGGGYKDATADISVTISDSVVTGSLSSPTSSGDGGSILGNGQDVDLVVDNVVIDLDFLATNSATPSGNFVSDTPLSRQITDLYVNEDKVTNSQWTLTDLSAQGNWGATLVGAANFGTSTSFPALTFGAVNGAATAGTWEVCPSGARPFHSIEASNCSTPTIDYPASLSLEFGDLTDTGFVGDATQFLYFTVSPSLPKGLYVNPASGKIVGQAVEEAATNNYTVTAIAANGSAQDTISISVAAPTGQVTLKSNLSPSQPDQMLSLGIVTAPEDPFNNSPYALAGWGVDGTSGRIFAPGAEILLTTASDLYAIWAIGPNCADNSGREVDEFYVLCEDPDGRTLRVTDSLPGADLSYFVADMVTTGEELWVTDGTSTGTRLLFEMEPGAADGADDVLGMLDGRLLFTGSQNGTYGLFATDGTLANTVRLTDLSSWIDGMEILDSVAVFSAEDQNAGRELWVTDGTSSGTALLADIETGGSDSWPYEFVRWGAEAYFVADTTQYGFQEIFKTDGTQAGTGLVAEVNPGAGDGGAESLTVANDKLFFRAVVTGFEGLWVLSAPGGTPQRLVTGDVSTVAPAPDGQSVVFGFDPTGNGVVNELWVSDGTVGGTKKVAAIAAAGIDASPYSFFDDGELIYFNSSAANGDLLAWKSDLTESGTTQILSSLSSPQLDGSVGGIVFGDYLVASGVRALIRSGEAPEVAPNQQQSPSVIAAPTNVPRLTGVPTFSSVTGILALPGANLGEVFRVEIQGVPLFSRFDAGVLSVQVPSSLATGERSLLLFSTSGRLTIQHTFSQSVSENEVLVNAWTKKLDDGAVKIYAKNIVGAGKIQFMVNGKEVAWIRAESPDDPKLRTAGGSHYLVRTINLSEGKNAIEVYVDGERVRRSAYTR